MTLFCGYPKVGLGLCMVYCPDGSGRCLKHKNKVSKVRNRSPKFRGSSKFQKEELGFKSTQE